MTEYRNYYAKPLPEDEFAQFVVDEAQWSECYNSVYTKPTRLHTSFHKDIGQKDFDRLLISTGAEVDEHPSDVKKTCTTLTVSRVHEHFKSPLGDTQIFFYLRKVS